MLIDANALVQPIAGAARSGPNLEYDSAFLALEDLHRPPQKSPGAAADKDGKVREKSELAFDPNWKDVAAKAADILRGAHDIRVLARLARAGLYVEGLGAFSAALAVLNGYLTQHWDSVHPQVEPEEGGALSRLNAVAAFTDGLDMLRSLRDTPLYQSRAFGEITYRKIEAARARLPAGANGKSPLTEAQIASAFADADKAEVARQLGHVRAARDLARAVDKALTDRLKQGNTVDFTELVKLLDAFERELGGRSPTARAAPETAGAVKANGADRESAPAAIVGAPGVIESRQDVIAALDRCCDYFRQHEPSSPVPLLLQRAKRLVTMDFVGIVRDLLAAPAVTQLEAVIGKQGDAGKAAEADKKS